MADKQGDHPRGKFHLGTLKYPAHALRPESLLNFTELKGFQDDWQNLGLDVESDLWSLQVNIMADPQAGEVMPGTGGLRKLRFASPHWDYGKRGGVRVLYVYFPEFGHVLLVLAYAKKDERDIGPRARKAIKSLIDEERNILTKQHFN